MCAIKNRAKNSPNITLSKLFTNQNIVHPKTFFQYSKGSLIFWSKSLHIKMIDHHNTFKWLSLEIAFTHSVKIHKLHRPLVQKCHSPQTHVTWRAAGSIKHILQLQEATALCNLYHCIPLAILNNISVCNVGFQGSCKQIAIKNLIEMIPKQVLIEALIFPYHMTFAKWSWNWSTYQ